jgi:hypothetical protein
MFKKILFASFILIAVIAGVCGYFYLKNIKKPKISAAQAIPSDCAFVIESDDFLKLFKTLNESSLIWDELQQVSCVQELNREVILADSLIRSNEKLNSIFASNKVYIAAYPSDGKETGFLFALNLPEINYTDEVISYLKEHAAEYEVTDVAGSPLKITRVVFKNPKFTFYCLINSGLLLISSKREMVENAVIAQGKKSLSQNAEFMKLEESAGKGNDLRLFVNHVKLDFFAKQLDQQKISSPVFKPGSNSGWTELDVDLKTNEVMLNGFTLADSSVFLSALKHQQPQEIECTAFMPASTKSFMFFGIEDYSLFAKDLGSQQATAGLDQKYSSRLDVDLHIAVQQLAGTELAMFRTSERDTTDMFALLRTNDRENAEKFLKDVADSSLYIGREDSLYEFRTPEFFNCIGLGLCTMKLNYCMLVNDYFLFAESREGVKRYLAALDQNKTLKLNEKFRHFSENNLGAEVNLYLYSSFAGSEDFLCNFANSELKKTLTENKPLFRTFDAAAYQLVNYKGALLNQAYLLYSPVSKQENTSVWETQLDTLSVTRPWIVFNHKTGGREILVQDESGTIYLISNTGKIQWKKGLEGKIMGEVSQVDYFKNEKLQFLFNTSTQIHLIDRNGNYVQGYPIELASPATGGIAVFDYEKNRDYRILVACENKKICNYTINGKPTEGFSFPETADLVRLPLQWIRVNQKDYLVAADIAGNVYVTGRRGEVRLTLKNRITPGCTSWFIDAGKDVSKTYIHFVDAENKTLNRLSLGDVSEKIIFDCEFKIQKSSFAYVNDDGLTDIILSDETGFRVIDDLGKPLLEYTSRENINPEIAFRAVGDQQYFFVLEEESGRCIPVNLAGREEKMNFRSGKTLPVITSFTDGGESFQLMISGSILYCFGMN